MYLFFSPWVILCLLGTILFKLNIFLKPVDGGLTLRSKDIVRFALLDNGITGVLIFFFPTITYD